jgi:hypothetical protein
MRTLVEPPPSSRCDVCHGELLIKRIDRDEPFFELDAEILVCAKCGREQSYVVSRDRYAAHSADKMPPAKVS